MYDCSRMLWPLKSDKIQKSETKQKYPPPPPPHHHHHHHHHQTHTHTQACAAPLKPAWWFNRSCQVCAGVKPLLHHYQNLVNFHCDWIRVSWWSHFEPWINTFLEERTSLAIERSHSVRYISWLWKLGTYIPLIANPCLGMRHLAIQMTAISRCRHSTNKK